jgi:hypothetical protein
VANNYKTAVHEANSADDRSQFPYIAEAEVIGMTDLRPGMPIYLDNVGNEYSGYWTILHVEHHVIENELNSQTYTSILTVGSDSLGQISSLKYPIKPSSTPIRVIKPNIKNTKVKPNTILKNTGLNLTPVKVTKLVSQVNRASVTGKGVSSSLWKSTHGDLNNVTKPNSSSAAVKAKVVNYRAQL